jgi:hypothetical protein
MPKAFEERLFPARIQSINARTHRSVARTPRAVILFGLIQPEFAARQKIPLTTCYDLQNKTNIAREGQP